MSIGEGLQSLDSLRNAARSIEIEWVSVSEQSQISGCTIADTEFRKRTGASIVGVQNEHGLLPNPSPDYTFRPADLLGVLGDSEQRCAARELIDMKPSTTSLS